MPWVLIPERTWVCKRFLVGTNLYGAPALAFAIIFHIIFGRLWFALLVGEAARIWFRVFPFRYVILALTIYGCGPAIMQ